LLALYASPSKYVILLHTLRRAWRGLQETFRVERVEGRLVVDVLRHALTACSLASFSLADCAQSLLARAARAALPAPAHA